MMLRFCLLIVFTIQIACAQSTYQSDMKKNIMQLDSAIKKHELHALSKSFSYISNQNQNQWLPPYYEAFCYLMIALEKKGKQADDWCDKAEKIISRIDSLDKNNSEIWVLKSLIAAARITVNQATRGQKYGAQAVRFADKAISLSSENPRAYLQKATAVYYTPEQFGGGAKKAKPILEMSIEKFKTHKKTSALHPDWGEDIAKQLLKEIKKKEANNAK